MPPSLELPVQAPAPASRNQRLLATSCASAVRAGEAGFTLTEIALALGIFAFALVSMLGLLSVGLKNTRKANVQVAASNLMTAVAADIQASTRVLKDGQYTYVTPRMNIKAVVALNGNVTSVAPENFVVDESGLILGANSDPKPLTKPFKLLLAAASPGTTALRITIQWPANTPPSAKPEGSLDALIPLPAP